MAYAKRSFSLFWSTPPQAADWGNLHLSGVQRMQLVLDFADDHTLLNLQEAGVRGVAVRINNADIATPGARAAVVVKLAHMVPLGVDTALLGNEPDNGYDLTYGAPTWGQDSAWVFKEQVSAMRQALLGVRVRTVSAAFTARSITEDEPPEPGLITWREIVAPVYDACDYCGFHLYEYNDASPVDTARLKWSLKWGEALLHKPLWIDELGVGAGTNVERMADYIQISKLLETHSLGQRVACLTPFVSAGVPGAWKPGYLLQDPAAYELLGAYLRS